MSPRCFTILACCLGAFLADAAAATSQVAKDAPIVDFRLPSFTPAGHRAWLVRGSEARFADQNDISITELTLTVFTGDATERIETLILSPAARVRPDEAVATGDSTIRVINDNFEATGAGWRYDHREKRVSIARNVRVTFHAELKNYLQ